MDSVPAEPVHQGLSEKPAAVQFAAGNEGSNPVQACECRSMLLLMAFRDGIPSFGLPPLFLRKCSRV